MSWSVWPSLTVNSPPEDKHRPNDVILHTVSHALCMNVCTIF